MKCEPNRPARQRVTDDPRPSRRGGLQENNGRDGDDWSYNNVRTGGAGAIGWRRPYDPAVAEQLRAAQRFADSGGHRASGKP
ncbi:hypothetical protein EOM89_14215 [Candidatus Falkowbacteria bacterium]|nr:hypothetical protein [Candidatus Falkowbacteria bacterium]